jgi:hypothetical protein
MEELKPGWQIVFIKRSRTSIAVRNIITARMPAPTALMSRLMSVTIIFRKQEALPSYMLIIRALIL